MVNEEYYQDYTKFLDSCKKGVVSAEEAGKTIVRMAHYFSQKNNTLAAVDKDLNAKAAEVVNEVDASGKQISVSKADLLIKATEEYAKSEDLKMHIKNIEQFINALKYLQRGILNEYAYAGS